MCAAVGVLLSINFAQDLRTLQAAAGEMPASPYLGKEFGPDLEMLDQLRQAIERPAERVGLRLLRQRGLGSDLREIGRVERGVVAVAGSEIAWVGPAERLAALLHDAPEYVIGDMISPFKAALGLD